MRISSRTLQISIAKYLTFTRGSAFNGFTVMGYKQYHHTKPWKRQKTALKATKEGSNEEVLLADVKDLLKRRNLPIQDDASREISSTSPSPKYCPPERFSEIEVEISELSSTGDGLGVSSTSDHVYVVPFTAPGDTVQAKVINYFPQEHYTLTDFVSIVKAAPQRDDSLVRCPYFARCAGCQIQMLPYESQLQHKKTIIEKAFRNFSSLTSEVVPNVGNTIASPLQYGYRTKLTPHFDGPPGSMGRRAKRNPSDIKGFTEVPPIGFMQKGTRKTIDVEDCPIGTDAVRAGLKRERKRIAEEIGKYRKGATILLRETTTRNPKLNARESTAKAREIEKPDTTADEEAVMPLAAADQLSAEEDRVSTNGSDFDRSPYVEEKSYITDEKATSTEYIDDFEFKNTAGAFFQNNNSILSRFTAYIRERIMPPSNDDGEKPIKYLIDAYCGSGLFTVTLSLLFSSSMGIDLAINSITSACENAKANGVSNASFMTADASKLFQKVTYPPEQTAVVIDPPRKGCDDSFLQQLLKFGPRRVVYVSCNVHTQARDVGVLVEGHGECRYEIESLQGFDFFPQTGHVEGVAVLERSKKEKEMSIYSNV